MLSSKPTLKNLNKIIIIFAMSDTASATKSFISGACGGFSLVFAAHPFDLVKVRMQTSQTTIPYKSTFHAFSTIIAKDGLRGMYRGAGPVLIATPPILAINMGAYHWAQNLMHATFSCQKDPYVSMDQLNLFQIGIAGSLASIPTSLLIGPAEQLKIRLQIQDSLSRKSAMGVFRTIISNGGFLALFRGTGLTLLRDVPTGFTYFATYEGLKRYFKDDKGHVPIHLVLLSGGCAG